MPPRPFQVALADSELSDLRTRLRHTRWPTTPPGVGWSQGVDPAYLREITTHWAEKFDWRGQEAHINTYQHFQVALSTADVHFIHHKAERDGVPIILTHGWPSTFLEYLPVIRPLTEAGFDVVVPSLPGYGFTTRPDQQHTLRDTARLWRELMHSLGYRRFAAHGGDFGSGVTTFLALDHPDDLIGIHLTNLELDPYLGPGSDPLTEAERALVEHEEEFVARAGGYNLLQSTTPLTAGYGLSDSPVGLAAWVLEKWRAWSDCGGDLERFDRDLLLSTLTLFWVTNTITDSMRDFHDNRDLYDALTADDRVRVPTAIGLFDNEFAHHGRMPKSWAERLYDVRRWTEMPSGGHFAAVEEPQALVDDLVEFFLS
ncbi:epoxide hydrolase family protein [Actinokineospora diospyrosa]|uniref:Pimeloyl-ACP methyl ester carboxylesterase n=1 Tax=Actinokineospora diospyrosa TaxID=103728 RepID=A0ABT1IIT7_9PSEU|nr:epoxide hydrolase family protein [Actinokineospora diospyrosa]MCP2272558.1 Pimeloyl-ACP methyl ester carboxylesterase [Actinokineospora diospyrosa]